MSIFNLLKSIIEIINHDKKDTILNRTRHRGYEFIPCTFAQIKSLTYEICELLINLAYYLDIFKLYKRELYKCQRNNHGKIDLSWERIVH